jgi:hypothetical protein
MLVYSTPVVHIYLLPIISPPLPFTLHFGPALTSYLHTPCAHSFCPARSLHDRTSQDASGYSPLQLAALLSDGGALAADLLARFPEVRVLWHMCVGTEGLAPEQLLMSTQQQQRARRRITTQFSLPC